MKFQFRVLAALFALVAFSLSVAEGVWASTCMPNMAMAAIAGAVPDAPVDCEMSAPADEPSEPGSNLPAPLHCPLTPLGASGSCTMLASLPVGPSADLVPSPEGALLAVSPDQTRDLLLVTALFHPPRV